MMMKIQMEMEFQMEMKIQMEMEFQTEMKLMIPLLLKAQSLSQARMDPLNLIAFHVCSISTGKSTSYPGSTGFSSTMPTQ
jgi:hypothetical protein